MSNPMREIARAMDKRAKQSHNTIVFSDSGSGPSSGDITHEHDDRYYRKTETDTKLSTKSDTTHSHTLEGLSDVPAYTGQAGKFIKVKATEDGIEYGEATGGASAFTSLTDAPASYSGQGGKVIAVKSTEDELEFINAGQATNGLPAGGTAGQVLGKVDGTDYNTQWIDASSGGGGTPTGDGTEDTNPDTLAESSSSYTGSISFIEILASFWLASIKFYIGATGGSVTVNVRNAGGQLLATKTVTATSSAWNTFTFDSPIKLTAKDYIVVEVLLSSQKLWRKTSTLYSGTLWKQKSHRINDFFTGSAYSETPGLGLIEYNG